MLSLFASYFVAMTVVPLFCARFLKRAHLEEDHVDTRSVFGRVIHRFNHRFERLLDRYERTLTRCAGAARARPSPASWAVCRRSAFVARTRFSASRSSRAPTPASS